MSQSVIRNSKFRIQDQWLLVGILLIAAAFRFLALDAAPPGWRDDELIEFNMDRRIADGWRPLFITEAEGHEPVYHYLHACTLLLFGDNLVGYKWLPLASGLLTIALTYALARKLFGANAARQLARGCHSGGECHSERSEESLGQPTASPVGPRDGALHRTLALPARASVCSSPQKDAPRNDTGARVALLAAALLAVSFWPIMYARFGLRHIGLLPWMLVAMYWLYPDKSTTEHTENTAINQGKLGVLSVLRGLLAGVCLAAGVMTYFAGRAVPIVLIGFLAYLLIFHRSILKRVWRRYVLAGFIAVAIAAPMFVEIARTPGAEQRTAVVGGPLIELRRGNLQPALETTLGTLGLFTFAGDPESLYNVPGRPVFDWITGAFFYLGVLVCLARLKRVESGFALAWLLIGLAPAFVSVPAASFSHTLAALPVVYIVAAYGVVWVSDTLRVTRWQGDKVKPVTMSPLLFVILSALVALNGWLTIRDYFGVWATDWIVQFQYHAPTRAIAKWLDQNPQVADVSIGTHASQLVLDPLALRLDSRRDIPASWFNAETALVRPPGGIVILSALQNPGDRTRDLIDATAQLLHVDSAFKVYTVTARPADVPLPGGSFDRGRLVLSSAVRTAETATSGESIGWRTYWQVPEPPSMPRAKLFLHALDDRHEIVAGDDRADINFATLRAGAAFWQISQLTLPTDLPSGRYAIEIGWYDPETGQRLKCDDGADRFLLPPLEVVAP
jgi:hypothetical protein